MSASACLTLAGVHLIIWLKQTARLAHLLFSTTAVSVAAIAACELLAMHAHTTEQFGRVVWWAHLPVFCAVISIVGFVRLHFRAGRPWLGYTVCGLRLLALIIKFCSVPNLNYTQITALRQRTIFGGETISIAQGIGNEWTKVGQLSSLLLLLFVLDASVTLWRRNDEIDRRRALLVGGSMMFFIFAAGVYSALVNAGIIQSPYLISVFFLPILAAMGYELSLEVVKAAELVQHLQASEAELRESEARFRILADTAPVMVWMSGTDMLCNFFNKPWLEFTGRTVEQELGNGWSEGVHTEDIQHCLETYISSFNARRPFTMEYRLRRADGEYRWVLYSGVPRYTSEAGFAGYIGSCIDITEQTRAEKALRESEQNMSLAASAAELALWTWDIPRNKIWTSGKGHVLINFANSDKLNLERFLDALHPEDRERVRQSVAMAVKGNGEYESEFRVTQQDGQVRWISARGRVEFDCGKPLRMRGVSLDITWRKHAELEVARQRNELAHLSRVTLMGELSGSLAHELNQPLTAILANAQAAQRFLAQGTADPAELQDILKEIVAEDKRAGEVIRRLRLLLEKGEVQVQPLDLNEAVNNVLRLLRSDLLNQNVAVHTELASHLPVVNGDSVQLQQVLLNLIVNGCDAMAGVEGIERRLSIRTELTDDKEVRVSVADYGRSIPPEKIERIFEPFFTTKKVGLGLGLTVCRTIIYAHGGRLWVTNNAERGATFQFTLPANEEGIA